MVGLAIAFPLSIGIALVEGTVLAYIIHPGGNATLLFAGVAHGICSRSSSSVSRTPRAASPAQSPRARGSSSASSPAC